MELMFESTISERVIVYQFLQVVKEVCSFVAMRAAFLCHNHIAVIKKVYCTPSLPSSLSLSRIKLFIANIHIAFVFRFYKT